MMSLLQSKYAFYIANIYIYIVVALDVHFLMQNIEQSRDLTRALGGLT